MKGQVGRFVAMARALGASDAKVIPAGVPLTRKNATSSPRPDAQAVSLALTGLQEAS